MESSPLWAVALLAIVVGPFIWALVYGIGHRDSGAPKEEQALEAQAMMQVLKDSIDVRSGGKGF
jgi:hypothetical protein